MQQGNLQLTQDAQGYHVHFRTTRTFWIHADAMSTWCRAQWGDTDHRDNAQYKWRRRMFSFTFTRPGYRDLFMLQWGHVNLQEHYLNDAIDC
jgi:hypothetical protein